MNMITTLKTGIANVAGLFAKLMPSAMNVGAERGDRLASDDAMERLYRTMWIDFDRKTQVRLMRTMDQQDGRVKTVHSRVARDVIKGGLLMQVSERFSSETLKREWTAFHARLQLNNSQKLKSDARGLLMEGNLPLQLVLDDARRDVVSAIRMPSETIVPMTNSSGRFANPANAFEQRDVMTGAVLANFAAWQLMLCRLDPYNFDDLGSMGRPWLDASCTVWKKLVMTEEDLVIRRRMRAPLRLAHVLEGADGPALTAYRKEVEGQKGEITTDFYLNRKGGVQAIQGDATLGDIADVAHLLDTFFAGSPAPKGLFGYTEGMARDILEDLKRDYYAEVDGLQDTLASAYMTAFRVHLLFKGIDPAPDEFTVRFAERRTETFNQAADLALKYIALGLPHRLVWAELGYDPDEIEAMLEEQRKKGDAYPVPNAAGRNPVAVPGRGAVPNVSVTPGNAPKGESATSINNPGGNGGRGRA